ncbi:unnamed protein product [Nippostrongylus brasiliensis]|uniref:Lectin_legB domain-containing protein n=1 Tax=Nippostrongylus brasiliensis TaxID=27835 RepID=A0A0N4XTG2_NIPBR|nr:unnamed protein product [Nippostrongylus brasiliensis]
MLEHVDAGEGAAASEEAENRNSIKIDISAEMNEMWIGFSDVDYDGLGHGQVDGTLCNQSGTFSPEKVGAVQCPTQQDAAVFNKKHACA